MEYDYHPRSLYNYVLDIVAYLSYTQVQLECNTTVLAGQDVADHMPEALRGASCHGIVTTKPVAAFEAVLGVEHLVVRLLIWDTQGSTRAGLPQHGVSLLEGVLPDLALVNRHDALKEAHIETLHQLDGATILACRQEAVPLTRPGDRCSIDGGSNLFVISPLPRLGCCLGEEPLLLGGMFSGHAVVTGHPNMEATLYEFIVLWSHGMINMPKLPHGTSHFYLSPSAVQGCTVHGRGTKNRNASSTRGCSMTYDSVALVTMKLNNTSRLATRDPSIHEKWEACPL